jgi:hypothetical protein
MKRHYAATPVKQWFKDHVAVVYGLGTEIFELAIGSLSRRGGCVGKYLQALQWHCI